MRAGTLSTAVGVVQLSKESATPSLVAPVLVGMGAALVILIPFFITTYKYTKKTFESREQVYPWGVVSVGLYHDLKDDGGTHVQVGPQPKRIYIGVKTSGPGTIELELVELLAPPEPDPKWANQRVSFDKQVEPYPGEWLTIFSLPEDFSWEHNPYVVKYRLKIHIAGAEHIVEDEVTLTPHTRVEIRNRILDVIMSA